MKVSQVIGGFAHAASGTSYFMMNVCRALIQNGVDVSLHFFSADKTAWNSFECHRYSVAYSPVRTVYRSPEMLEGLRTAARHDEIIHANGLWMMPNVYPAWAVKGTRCKLVHSPHGMLSRWALSRSKWKKRIFGWLWQYRALKQVDMFHVTSQKEYDEIRALGYKQPVAIIPLGVEVLENRLKVEGWRLNGGGTRLHRVVFFGRLHKVKAVDRLVQAWELLNQGVDERCRCTVENVHCTSTPSTYPSLSSWELVIAGPDNGIRGELERYIANHKIPRVRFVGEINGPAKYEFLSDADLYVLPSFTENFGVTVAEALACGTPVIVSKGTPWSGVRRVQCGFWVDNDPETLAKTLREAMSLSDDERCRMGEVGREWIRRDFSWEGVGKKMKAAYEWLLDSEHVEKPEWVRVV